MTLPKFDSTISLTHVIAIAGILFSGIGIWSSYRVEMGGVLSNQTTATKRAETLESRHERLEGRTLDVERKVAGMNEGLSYIKLGIDEIKQELKANREARSK